MKTFREMRHEAWKVATSKWLFRLLLPWMIFLLISTAVLVPLQMFFKENGIQTWEMFAEAQRAIARSGLEYAVPSFQQAITMTWASTLTNFLSTLFQSIFIFGTISVALRAVRDQQEGWFGSAFSGFKAPFSLLWLSVLMGIRILLWALLFIIPGIIALFRYAVAWYVKSEHPDYSAGRCLDESGRLMKGHKWQLFLYGLSYIGWILLAIGAMIVSAAFTAVMPALGALVSVIPLSFFVFVLVYIVFGQAVFYSELKKSPEAKEENEDL